MKNLASWKPWKDIGDSAYGAGPQMHSCLPTGPALAKAGRSALAAGDN